MNESRIVLKSCYCMRLISDDSDQTPSDEQSADSTFHRLWIMCCMNFFIVESDRHLGTKIGCNYWPEMLF